MTPDRRWPRPCPDAERSRPNPTRLQPRPGPGCASASRSTGSDRKWQCAFQTWSADPPRSAPAAGRCRAGTDQNPGHAIPETPAADPRPARPDAIPPAHCAQRSPDRRRPRQSGREYRRHAPATGRWAGIRHNRTDGRGFRESSNRNGSANPAPAWTNDRIFAWRYASDHVVSWGFPRKEVTSDSGKALQCRCRPSSAAALR